MKLDIDKTIAAFGSAQVVRSGETEALAEARRLRRSVLAQIMGEWDLPPVQPVSSYWRESA